MYSKLQMQPWQRRILTTVNKEYDVVAQILTLYELLDFKPRVDI